MNEADLKLLGAATTYSYSNPTRDILEVFPAPRWRNNSPTVYIEAPEFTSLCPKTGQPDFATIVIEYQPLDVCVESKSLKLYLGAYRQTGMFHEACVVRIFDDLCAVLNPIWMEVEGRFSPRGGIKFWPKLSVGVRQ